MTVRWERFAGSTDSFAVRLAFMPDPDGGAGADPADAASWGSVQFWVDGQNLCTHVDQGEILQSAHWYLLPVLEWFAENWDPLLHEEPLPNDNVGENAAEGLAATRDAPALEGEAETVSWEEEWYEWRSRHALRTARNGGLLPNIVIRRLRDLVEISWNDEPLAGTPAGFRFSATHGTALLSPDQVAQPLHEVITAAATYLKNVAPDEERFARLCTLVDKIADRGEKQARIEWLAGLRKTPDITERLTRAAGKRRTSNRWSEVVTALRNVDGAAARGLLTVDSSPLVITGSCHAALMFSSVSPTITENDVRTIATALVERYSPDPVDLDFDGLGEPTPLDPAVRPWEQGYELAEAIHLELDLDLSKGWVDIATAMERLGISLTTFRLDDTSIRACCIIGRHYQPTIIQNEKSPFYRSNNAQRFNMAHELCHLLFDQSAARKLAIASGPWAPKALERRANAFAAMFLMPPKAVQEAIADSPNHLYGIAEISAIAKKLHVSEKSLIQHLHNMTRMSESERDDLLRLAKE